MTEPDGPDGGPGPPGDVVTALRFDEAAVAVELARWCGGEVAEASDGQVVILVRTDRGPKAARLGDWIVGRPDGGFYPCSPAEFAARHEPLS